MIMNENIIKLKFGNVIGMISELSIRRSYPFDEMPLDIKDYNYTYGNYLKFGHELEEGFRNKLMDAIIEKNKFLINNHLLGGSEEFSDKFSDYSKTIKRFFDWIKENEKEYIDIDDFLDNFNEKEEEINIVQDIRQTFIEKLPSCDCRKKRLSTGELKFTCSIHKNCKIMILVDPGTWRSWLNISVGVETPEILFDINEILSLNNRTFSFRTKKQAVSTVSKAAEILKKILIVMEEKLAC